MSDRTERLYALLPAVLRQRDAETGEGLRALMAVLEEQLAAIEADIETTWDNWFVETCEEWLVPYLGETMGVTGLRELDSDEFTLRGYVANTIARRRRKGTAAATEQLARDVTLYPTRAVEMFALTAITTSVKHVREFEALPARLGTVDLRDGLRLERLGGPFDDNAHLADVRPMDATAARHNLPNLALFQWRTQSWRVEGGGARAIVGEPGWYRFDPLGLEVELHNVPSSDDIEGFAQPAHVPHALTRLELRDAGLEAAPIAVWTIADGVETELDVEICDLEDFEGNVPSHAPPPGVASVDPERGRLVLNPGDVPPAAAQPFEVVVDYAYASLGRVGAGPFDRSDTWDAIFDGIAPTRQWGISRAHDAVGAESIVETFEEAVLAWNAWIASLDPEDQREAVGLFSILDSRSYDAPTTPIDLTGGARLFVVAATWTITVEDGVPRREVGDVVASGLRPHVQGDIELAGSSAGGDEHAGGFWMNGVALEGTLRVGAGDLERLELAHCTIPEATGGVEIAAATGAANSSLSIRLERCFLGPVTSAGAIAGAYAKDCLIRTRTAGAFALDLVDTDVQLTSSTLIGGVRGRSLHASDCVLDEGERAPGEALELSVHQEGCLRFSYVPHEASAPRRYRCQPDLALEGVDDAAEQRRVLARVRPMYASEELRDPTFGMLAAAGPEELRTAASDSSEPGVWHHLQHSLRLANLRAALRHDLRFGLDAEAVLEP